MIILLHTGGDCESEVSYEVKSDAISASWMPPDCDGWSDIETYTLSYECMKCDPPRFTSQNTTDIYTSITLNAGLHQFNITATNECGESTTLSSKILAIGAATGKLIKYCGLIYH